MTGGICTSGGVANVKDKIIAMVPQVERAREKATGAVTPFCYTEKITVCPLLIFSSLTYSALLSPSACVVLYGLFLSPFTVAVPFQLSDFTFFLRRDTIKSTIPAQLRQIMYGINYLASHRVHDVLGRNESIFNVSDVGVYVKASPHSSERLCCPKITISLSSVLALYDTKKVR